MSQNDFQIANDSGAAVRSDLNSALQALATLSSGNNAPSTTYAGQLWWDTGNDKIKIRNGANSAWVDFAHYDGVTYEPIAAGSDVLKADPEHATDSATDAYDSATNTTPPADGVQIVRDFQSPNTTTTPTLDGKTVTDRDGNALWASAISGPHTLQRDQTADTYLLLYPIGTDANVNNAPVSRDANGRAKFADPSAAQDVVTKSYGDTNYTDTGAVTIKESGTVSSAASLDITDLESGFDYEIVVTGLVPATDNTQFQLITSTDNGSSFETGASAYAYSTSQLTGGTVTGSQSNSNDRIVVAQALGAAAGEFLSGVIHINKPMDDTEFTSITFDGDQDDSSSSRVHPVASGHRNTAEANDAVRLLMGSGNISSMKYVVRKIARS